MNGMADIIPPAPAHDGLAALLAPASASSGWLLAFTLLIMLALLLSAWLMRRRLLARLRLAQARRSLHAGRVDVIEKLLRQHYELAQLHPAKPPVDINAACWRALAEGLHEIRFGINAVIPSVLSPLLNDAFTPSPLTGEGWGEGGDAGRAFAVDTVAAPSPQRLRPPRCALPTRGEGANRPHGHDGVRP